MKIADDFDAIRARIAELTSGPAAPEACPNCEGSGWECYGTGHKDPHFRVCEACGNPEGRPSP